MSAAAEDAVYAFAAAQKPIDRFCEAYASARDAAAEDGGVALRLKGSDWTIFAPDPKGALDLEAPAATDALSFRDDLYVCRASVKTLSSYCALIRSTKVLWSVHHTRERGPDHFEVEGDPPELVERLRSAAVAAPAASDAASAADPLWPVPLRAFAEVTGFAYDAQYPPSAFAEGPVRIRAEKRRTALGDILNFWRGRR